MLLTIHAEEEMNFDNFSILDVESAILNGTIIERQTDTETGEFKYIMEGSALDDRTVGIVAKLSPTNKLVIITIYAAEI